MVLAGALGVCGLARGADYIVDPAYKGNPGDNNTYASLPDAVKAVPAGQSADKPNRILIKPGTYKQQLTIAADNVCLIGTSGSADDVIICDDLNARTPKPDGSGNYGTTGASSTFIKANHVSVANVTFKNLTPYGGSQAVALKTTGDEIAFRNCDFLSFQDTLYPTGGRVYFDHCKISGSVDFIFGNATAVFDHCAIESSHPGCVTAANTAAATAIGFVFLDCTLAVDDAAAAGSVQLGRPWQYARTDANVVFIRCKMDAKISPAGWNPWDQSNDNPGGDSRYAEFGSLDSDGKPSDVSQRVEWSHQLTADQAKQFTLGNIFGPGDFWWKGGWPAVWGTRNHPVDSYKDWKLGGTWDAGAQLESAELKADAGT